jgi:two-component system, NtrC family, sensor kinase
VRALGGRFAILLLAAVVAVPLALWCVATWIEYRQVMAALEREADRTADLLLEHTAKVFETHELALLLVDLRARGMDWTTIRESRELHADLASISDKLAQVDSLWLVDETGTYWASSQIAPPMQPVPVADRDFMLAYRSGFRGLYVSDPFVGRATGRQAFNTSMARTGPDGGIVIASIRPDYFQDFFGRVLPGSDRVIGLTKESGAILVRYPPLPGTAPTRLSAASGLLRAITTEPKRGMFRTVAQVDGVERLYAYRRIDGYPVYVSIGLAVSEARAEWRRLTLGYGAAAAVAAALLLALALYGLRAAASARRAQEQLARAQRLEALGRLTGGIAHDFNNVLQSVGSVLNIIERHVDDPAAGRVLEAGRETLGRARDRIRQLLTFAREQKLTPAVLDLNTLVRHVTTLMRPGLDGIEVGLELAADLAPVRLDAAQAEHALINLLVNARDAMPDGGRLTLATANVALTDGAPGWVQLTVSDSGPGIEPQALPQLFEPFFTTKPDGQGTGLGLSQVHGFVHQAGGQVEVDSEPGRGARFHLLLPQAAEEPPPQRQGAATGP